MGDHYINQVGKYIFPTAAATYGFINTVTSDDFATKAYGFVKENIPVAERIPGL